MNMKNFFALALSATMTLSLAACGGTQKPDTDGSAASPQSISAETTSANAAGTITGGWTINNGELTLEKNPEAKAAFDKALENLVGADYEVLAYLGSQIVAGTNYRFLCRVTPVVPDAESSFALVTVYENLDGDAEFLSVDDLADVPAGDKALPGGWLVNGDDISIDADEDVKAAFVKALDGLTGADYEPIAVLASQVVAGMNYKIFCRVTPVYPDAEPGFAVVTVYAALDDSAELTDVADVDVFASSGEMEESSVQMPTPFAEYTDQAEAERAAGYAFGTPGAIEGYDEPVYLVWNDGSLYEALYQGGENQIVLRKGVGDADYSGDYNSYSESETDEATGVTYQGNSGTVSLAKWTADGYSYSVGAYDEGLDADTIRAFVAEIIALNR